MPLALHGLAVDAEDSVEHLNTVTRQSDDALDVIGVVVAWQLEHRDIAALGLAEEARPGNAGS